MFLRLALIFCLLSSALFAVDHRADRRARSYSTRKVRTRVDHYDFSGNFPHLENIDIDAKRKKQVEFDLTGDYPILHTLNYEGSFGELNGQFTGNYPKLKLVNLLCTSCAMDLNLNGNWQRSCVINIRGEKEDIVLSLPTGVGLIINTHVGATGKVVAKEGLKKQGWMKVLNKTYHNALVETAPVVLTLNIETSSGNIVLN